MSVHVCAKTSMPARQEGSAWLASPKPSSARSLRPMGSPVPAVLQCSPHPTLHPSYALCTEYSVAKAAFQRHRSGCPCPVIEVAQNTWYSVLRMYAYATVCLFPV